jgi:hypothetical protein
MDGGNAKNAGAFFGLPTDRTLSFCDTFCCCELLEQPALY